MNEYIVYYTSVFDMNDVIIIKADTEREAYIKFEDMRPLSTVIGISLAS